MSDSLDHLIRPPARLRALLAGGRTLVRLYMSTRVLLSIQLYLSTIKSTRVLEYSSTRVESNYSTSTSPYCFASREAAHGRKLAKLGAVQHGLYALRGKLIE